LAIVAGLKREKKFRFSVFNPQDPRDPRDPQAKPREEEGFFGLVPLVTHPSSIPLLGGLTPKGPMSVDGFLGSLGRFSRRQKHE
jgi:hypothetical protein